MTGSVVPETNDMSEFETWSASGLEFETLDEVGPTVDLSQIFVNMLYFGIFCRDEPRISISSTGRDRENIS
jgi:hypothetical protein